jgi:hypothetical protein
VITRRIARVPQVINWNLLTIATIIAERNINQTPGRDSIVRTKPARDNRPANI